MKKRRIIIAVISIIVVAAMVLFDMLYMKKDKKEELPQEEKKVEEIVWITESSIEGVQSEMEEALNALLKKRGCEYKVRFVCFPMETYEEDVAEYLENNSADIIYSNLRVVGDDSNQYYSFYKNGYLQNLEKIREDEKFYDAYSEKTWEHMEINGEIYGIPSYSYMTDQQGKMTEEKVEYFNEERKRFEEIYSMTPENSDLTAVEIVQKQEENKYAHEGFSEAYSQVMYIMSNNQGKGVNEQELVYEKGYQLLFGDKAVKERLIGILLCVIAAVYSASGVLGTEYDLKVMNLLRSTKRGRKELFLKKLGVSFGITAVIFVLVKIPAILKVVGEYPLECWGAKVRSMMFAGQSVINCSIFGYVLMLMIMQLVTLFVIVFSTMALSVVLKDSTMTMILSLLLFGGPLLIEWGGVPIVHYLSLNSLLDGHQILQGNWLVLISEIVIFWGALSFAAGYVLYRAYENRR